MQTTSVLEPPSKLSNNPIGKFFLIFTKVICKTLLWFRFNYYFSNITSNLVLMSIGNKIKHLRELKNLSQDYMAKQLDISQKAYSNIENEVSEITVNRLENISKILGVSMTQILNLNEENIFQNIFNNQNESKNNYTVNNNHANMQKELYEKIIAEKEAHIVTLSQLLKTK